MRSITALCGCLLLSVVIVGSVWVGCSAAYFPLTAIDLDKGGRLFADRCASCHGIQEQAGVSYGPSLARIGATSRVPGMSAEEYLAASITSPNAYRRQGETGVMPADISAGMSREDVMSIVGFLTTLDGAPNTRRLAAMVHDVKFEELPDRSMPQFARAEAGKQLFVGKANCAKCHALKELPGFDLWGPSILAAGRHDAKYLEESIRDPNKAITPGYDSYLVWLASGQTVSGRLLRSGADSHDLLVSDIDGPRVVTIAKSDIEIDEQGQPMIHRSQKSAMPANTHSSLTDVEIQNIVAFLETLH